jgi:hypothetical protein
VVCPNDRFVWFARLATPRIGEARHDPGHVRQWTPGDLRGFLGRSEFRMTGSHVVPFRVWPLCLHGVMAAVKQRSQGAPTFPPVPS